MTLCNNAGYSNEKCAKVCDARNQEKLYKCMSACSAKGGDHNSCKVMCREQVMSGAFFDEPLLPAAFGYPAASVSAFVAGLLVMWLVIKFLRKRR